MVYNKIDNILKTKGIKIKTLAEYLGVCPNTISLKLKGKREFKVSEIIKIAFFLGEKPSYFLEN